MPIGEILLVVVFYLALRMQLISGHDLIVASALIPGAASRTRCHLSRADARRGWSGHQQWRVTLRLEGLGVVECAYRPEVVTVTLRGRIRSGDPARSRPAAG
jgi:hypothetical protein